MKYGLLPSSMTEMYKGCRQICNYSSWNTTICYLYNLHICALWFLNPDRDFWFDLHFCQAECVRYYSQSAPLIIKRCIYEPLYFWLNCSKTIVILEIQMIPPFKVIARKVVLSTQSTYSTLCLCLFELKGALNSSSYLHLTLPIYFFHQWKRSITF